MTSNNNCAFCIIGSMKQSCKCRGFSSIWQLYFLLCANESAFCFLPQSSALHVAWFLTFLMIGGHWQGLDLETSKWKARSSHLLLDTIAHGRPTPGTSSHHPLLIFRGLNDASGTEVERLTQNYFLELVVIATGRELHQWPLWQLPGQSAYCLLTL